MTIKTLNTDEKESFNWSVTMSKNCKVRKVNIINALQPLTRWRYDTTESYRAHLFELIRYESLDVKDYKSLYLLGDAYDDYYKAVQFLNENGKTYETKNSRGSIIYTDYPQVKHQIDAEKKLTKWLEHFGLTPKASGKFKKMNEADLEEDDADWEG